MTVCIYRYIYTLQLCIKENELYLPFAASPSTKFKLWLSSVVKFDLELKRRIRASRVFESGFIVRSKPTFNNMNAKFVGCSKAGCDSSLEFVPKPE